MPLVQLIVLLATLICLPVRLCAHDEMSEATGAGAKSCAREWVAQLAGKVNFTHPLRDYDCRRVAGWSVLTEQEMNSQDPQLTRRALAQLEVKLKKVKDLLPFHTLAILQRTPIFLLNGTNATLGGRQSGAQYFAPTAPDFDKTLDPRMGGSVVIYSARHFLTMSDFGAVKLLVHELAHSWHLSQWSELKPDIMMSYKNAMSNGLYMNVRTAQGQVLEKTYATKNQLEYFAELSAIWFCGNDHFPFHRSDVQLYDPSGFRLMEKLWMPRTDLTMR